MLSLTPAQWASVHDSSFIVYFKYVVPEVFLMVDLLAKEKSKYLVAVDRFIPLIPK